MKKVIEEVVERNQNIIEYIIRLASDKSKGKVWIFVSEELYADLEKKYKKQLYPREDGAEFFDNDGRSISIVNWREGRLYWAEVIFTSKCSLCLDSTGDPEVIYFLS